MRKILLLFLVLCTLTLTAQRKKQATSKTTKTVLEEANLSGLKFRSIGPALTSGRISDLAVNPDNFNEYYGATSSAAPYTPGNINFLE